jgi:hypothetical protein
MNINDKGIDRRIQRPVLSVFLDMFREQLHQEENNKRKELKLALHIRSNKGE